MVLLCFERAQMDLIAACPHRPAQTAAETRTRIGVSWTGPRAPTECLVARVAVARFGCYCESPSGLDCCHSHLVFNVTARSRFMIYAPVRNLPLACYGSPCAPDSIQLLLYQ